jgi:hypothetical protein
MDKIVVTVVCSVALVLAAGAVLKWGHLDASFRDVHGNAIARAMRRLCVLEVSGIVAGLLVGGFGSRLMMRVIAATSSAAAQGRLTQADEVVGKVTQEGTVGLLIFVGIGFGIVGALLYALVVRFLPNRAWLSGAIAGLLALGIFARRDPLDPSNRDFTFLSPVALAVVIIVVLFVLYGMTLASVAARLERFYPPFEGGWKLTAYAPLVLLILPPLTFGILAALLAGAVSQRFPEVRRRLASRAARTAGVAVVAIAAVASNVWLAFAVVDILTT